VTPFGSLAKLQAITLPVVVPVTAILDFSACAPVMVWSAAGAVRTMPEALTRKLVPPRLMGFGQMIETGFRL